MGAGALHKFNILQKEEFFENNNIAYDLANELVDYWGRRLDSLLTVDMQSYFDYSLFFLSMRENIFAVVIYDHIAKKTQFEYGIMNIFSETDTNIADPDPILNTIKIYKEQEVNIRRVSLRTVDMLKHFTILIAAPKGYRIRPYWLKLKSLFSIYHIYKFKRETDKVINFFSSVNKSVLDAFDSSGGPRQCVCLTYFKLSSLKDYAMVMGENFVTECEKFIFTNIKEKAPKSSELYILNAEEYLLITPNSTEEVLKEKFYKVSFKMKDLLITYQIKFFTLKDKIKDIASVWNEIRIY